MSDIKLITKRQPGQTPVPPQSGNPPEYFGEETNDLQLNSINDLDIVSGLTKLKQDINKILLTERGENTLFPLYGTELQSMVGGKVNPDTIKAKIKDEIIGGLQTLQFINRDNPNLDEQPEILELLDIQSNKRVSTGVTVQL
jgi:hypothetical protein